MISDALFDAVEDIKDYLNDPLYNDIYGPEIRSRLIALCEEMKAIQRELDTPPVPLKGKAKQ